VRKTALMSEANAAYARKDIVTLMDIQQRVALADPQAVASLPDDKLKSLTLLVKAQVAELERQRARTQQTLCHEFDVPPHMGLNANTLKQLLMAQEGELTESVAHAASRPGAGAATRWAQTLADPPAQAGPAGGARTRPVSGLGQGLNGYGPVALAQAACRRCSKASLKGQLFFECCVGRG
jgi:hypothetical protein